MRHEDDYIGGWRTTRVDKSRPPLRWIANLAGEIASKGLLDISYMEEEENFGLRYKFCSLIYDIFMPTYNKYGTFYKVIFEEEEDI